MASEREREEGLAAQPIFAEAMMMEAIYGAGSQHALPPSTCASECGSLTGRRRGKLLSVWSPY